MIIDLSPPIAIACDDIRQESSGKFILIGVYSGDLIVPSFPYTLTLSYLVLVKGSHVGDVKFQFDVTLNDKQVARILGEAELSARPPDYVLQLPVGAVPIQFDEACDLLLRCSFDEGSTWQTASQLKVRSAAPPAQALPDRKKNVPFEN